MLYEVITRCLQNTYSIGFILVFHPLFQLIHLVFIHNNGPRSTLTFKQGHTLAIKSPVLAEQVSEGFDLLIGESDGSFQVTQGFVRALQFTICQSARKECSTSLMVKSYNFV